MATQSSTSDSIDDPNFQAFLREPLSNESSIAVEEVKQKEKVSRPKSPPKLWWLKNNSAPSNSNKPREDEKTADLTVPEAQLSWLKTTASTSGAALTPLLGLSKDKSPQPTNEPTHSADKSKEPSPGIPTSSAATDSMAEFLEKETQFKEESEKEKAKKKEDDASSDTLIDDEYGEDFTEDISDELYGASQADVKAIMQMLAKQLESVELHELDIPDLNLPDPTEQSGGSSRERSVEEILEEVEELERSASQSSSCEKNKPDLTKGLISSHEQTLQPMAGTTGTPDPITPLPLQGSTPKPQDKLLEPDLSLKLPSSSVESITSEHLASSQHHTFTLLNSQIGPGGDIPNVTESIKDTRILRDSISESKKSLASDKSKKSENSGQDSAKLHAHSTLEELLLAEQSKYLKLQESFEKREKDHEKLVENLKIEYEKEVFELKKHSYYLNAKVQDLELAKQEDHNSTRTDHSSEVKVQLLEAEVQKQEQLIVATQKENEKLCNQIKEFKVCTIVLLLFCWIFVFTINLIKHSSSLKILFNFQNKIKSGQLMHSVKPSYNCLQNAIHIKSIFKVFVYV